MFLGGPYLLLVPGFEIFCKDPAYKYSTCTGKKIDYN